MEIPISEAKGQLSELVRQAESGTEVLLTRHGQPVARITGIGPSYDREKRRAALERLRDEGAKAISPGPCAARSQDFLYDDFGVSV